MMHLVRVTVRTEKGKEKMVSAKVNAHNGKGAIRVFLLQSEALSEIGKDVIAVTCERLEEETPKGFVAEEIEKAPRKPKAEAAAEPAAE